MLTETKLGFLYYCTFFFIVPKILIDLSKNWNTCTIVHLENMIYFGRIMLVFCQVLTDALLFRASQRTSTTQSQTLGYYRNIFKGFSKVAYGLDFLRLVSIGPFFLGQFVECEVRIMVRLGYVRLSFIFCKILCNNIWFIEGPSDLDKQNLPLFTGRK